MPCVPAELILIKAENLVVLGLKQYMDRRATAGNSSCLSLQEIWVHWSTDVSSTFGGKFAVAKSAVHFSWWVHSDQSDAKRH